MAPDKILGELSGREFSSARDFEECVVEVFNRHLGELPPQYSYRELIQWGTDRDLIVRDDKRGVYYIELKASARPRGQGRLGRFFDRL